jgi:hypothetical protein
MWSRSDDDTHSDFPEDSGGEDDPGLIQIPESGHNVIDCNLGSIFYVLLTMDCILDPLVNAKNGRPVILIVRQDATGGHKIAFDDKYRTGMDIDDLATSGTANGQDYYGFIYCAPDDRIDVVAFVREYVG